MLRFEIKGVGICLSYQLRRQYRPVCKLAKLYPSTESEQWLERQRAMQIQETIPSPLEVVLFQSPV